MAQVHTRPIEYPSTRDVARVRESELDERAIQAKSIGHLQAIWRDRRTVARVAFAGLLAGALLAFLLPTRYTSVARLMPPDRQSSGGMALLAALSGKTGGSTGSSLAGAAGDLLGMGSSGAVFVGILQSDTVQNRLVERFDLKKVYWDHFEEDARKDLADRTSVSEDRKSGIISISVVDRERWRATALAQAYVDELNHLSAELSTSAAHRERVFLEERLQTVKKDLDQASVDFSQFSSKNTAIDIKEQARAMVEAAAQLQGQLIASESQLKGLEAIYAPGNPRVHALEARISELRSQLEKLGGAGVDANGNISSELYPSIRQLPILGVKYADLYRKAKIQETVFEMLTQQYELAKVQEAKETPTVKVLDPASRPERRSFPPRLVIILLCGSFALALGAFWAVARDRWQKTEDMDPRKVFAQEVMDSLEKHMPWATPNGSKAQAIAHRIWIRFTPQTNRSQNSESDTDE
ncbi:MAG TPA: Wzz/FepE/Etk N-terminal domain-containing protein [Candidatus Sulfotelmatobacter sp.]|nr:Wzz/FepE/Etk N-terminal domain-containing protein [Candidatus Sulfotelmatobacter sp.]